ncbi:hypothetical protein MW371_005849 [Pseudomonas aeruginosa]|nr:hypothetical protein [Pseudomonas aeruginosa]
MKRNANPAATVAAWNSAYPAGTEVNYRSHRHATPKRTRTVGRASVSLGGAAVIWIEGQSAPVALRACTAVT